MAYFNTMMPRQEQNLIFIEAQPSHEMYKCWLSWWQILNVNGTMIVIAAYVGNKYFYCSAKAVNSIKRKN